MKELTVNLYISRKRTIFLISSFALVSFVVCFFVVLSVKADLMQLNSLLQSDYLYSVTVGEIEAPDAFFQYNAGISFAITPESSTGMNADVVMQTAGSEYTDSVFWNAGRMEGDEVAVSKGIARAYGLKWGDFIYSKNVVDGTVREYLIKQVLSDVSTVRVQEGQNFANGVIIMGYDSNYADNVSHNILLFTDIDVNLLSEKSDGTLSGIVYRDDEIQCTCQKILPYLVFLFVLAITITILLATILKRAILHNFKRLIMLGFDQNRLNRSLFSLIFGIGIVSIMVSLIITIAVFGIIELNIVTLVLLLSVVFVECITLLIAEADIKKQLWRQ